MKKIVALGGGHGLSNILKGLSLLDDIEITAIVSVADDGGSSGRLRKELDVVALGDIRSCISALAQEEDTNEAIHKMCDYRFDKGELNGHSLGNLMLVALIREYGNLDDAICKFSSLLNIKGRVLAATSTNVVLAAKTKSKIVEGQVNIEKTSDIEKVYLTPQDPKTDAKVIEAISLADLIIYAPGSLYTSLIPVLIIPDLANALNTSAAKKIMILNLFNKGSDTINYSGNDHVNAVLEHSAKIDSILQDSNGLIADNFENTITEVLSFDNETHDGQALAKAISTHFL